MPTGEKHSCVTNQQLGELIEGLQATVLGAIGEQARRLTTMSEALRLLETQDALERGRETHERLKKVEAEVIKLQQFKFYIMGMCALSGGLSLAIEHALKVFH